jgi:hypothetical protein
MNKYLIMLIFGFLMFSKLFLQLLFWILASSVIAVLTFPKVIGCTIIVYSILKIHRIHRLKNENNE